MVYMRARHVLTGLVVLALGLVATLISGFYEQDLSKPGLSKIGYGFPLVWHGHSWIIYPTMPTVYWFSSEPFLWDTAFWCLISTLIVLILLKLTKPSLHKS
jgi:hypothetical protein